jgi:hypothetical protein
VQAFIDNENQSKLKYKISEKYVSRQIYDEIMRNWKLDVSLINLDLIDEVNRTTLNLRVPFKFRGEKTHMSVSSEIVSHKVGNGYNMEMHCNILSPIIYSSSIGISVAFITTNAGAHILLGSLIGLLLGLIVFAYLKDIIRRTSNDYLDTLALKYYK